MAMVRTLIYTRITLQLLLLGVSLSIHGLSQARPSQHFSSPEVVIPSKVTSRGRGAKAPGWLSYRLRIGGQRHTVHLRVKRLLVSTHLPVFTYTEQHGLQEDHPFVPDDCYYHGYVEGAPESLVALSTCSGGFRGMLQINDLVYEIKSIRYSTTFEHLVYQVGSDEMESPLMRCGLTEESIARRLELQASYSSTLKQSSYVGWWTHQRFVELVVVVDHVRFLYSQSNVSVMYYEVFHVINIVDEFYHPLEIDVFLIGIEIWTKRNPISTNDDLDQVGQDFSIWKSTNLEHDAAHLFIKELNGLKLGVAYFKGICLYTFNCAVDVFEDKRLSVFAITVAHELGHNLGMLHDTEWCVCEQEWCVLCPRRRMTTKFSNCSYSNYFDNILGSRLRILAPPFHGNIYRLQHCGNQVVEVGEECDCGSIQQCQHDPWCLLNCVLKPGTACASRVSCKDYKFMPSGTLCRQQVNQCDLPEWCNGTSHKGPDDVYVQDGMPCDSNSYRFKKMCNNHDIQCKKIFGQEARSMSEICYNEMNTQGTRFGHCGIEGTTYVKCMAPDVMCGRVQCENVLTIPTLVEHSTVHQFHFNGTTCWGTDYHFGMSIPDIGEVKDGTVCAPGKLYLRRKCVSMVHLPKYREPLHCNMRGICNNKQHCHCRRGWAPLNCSSRGYGDSVDSGPPSNIKLEGSHMEGDMGFLLPLLLISWVVLCLFCFLVLCTKERRGERK